MLKNKYIKLLHIILVMLISIVIITAILNTTLLSKASIMGIIDYTLTMTNAQISPVDSIFIARVIRQQIWQVHFYFGVATTILAIIIAIMIFSSYKSPLFQKSAIKLSVLFNSAIIALMAISGTLLFYRDKLGITEAAGGILLRDYHWIGLYLAGFFLLFHLYVFITKRVSR
jgi:hypothetical protein